MHILVVEDDAVTSMTLSAKLKGLGYEVTVAADGEEAWADLRLARYLGGMEAVDIEELHARLKVAERILGLRQHVHQRYVDARSEAQFSHGYCPDCYEKYVRPQIEGR